MTNVAAPPRHLPSLDGLRVIGAVAVVLVHVAYLERGYISGYGFFAVDLLFMLSGFVVARAYEDRVRAGLSWRRFMSHRVERLYPSMLLGVVLGAVAHALVGVDGGSDWWSFGHVVLVPDFRGGGLFPLNGVLWSLFFIVIFNAMHAAIVRHLSTRRLVLFVLVIGPLWAYAALSVANWGAGWNRDTFAAGFARVGWGYGVGVLIHRWHASGRWRPPSVSVVVPLTICAVVLADQSTMSGRARLVLTAFVLLPSIVAISATSRVPPAFAAPLRWLGARSYPLYTTHLPLLIIAAEVANQYGGVRRAFAWTGATAGCVVVAALIRPVYEAPAQRSLARRMAVGAKRPLPSLASGRGPRPDP